jgi:quercetin dioxygenase-like cupin family protein
LIEKVVLLNSTCPTNNNSQQQDTRTPSRASRDDGGIVQQMQFIGRSARPSMMMATTPVAARNSTTMPLREGFRNSHLPVPSRPPSSASWTKMQLRRRRCTRPMAVAAPPAAAKPPTPQQRSSGVVSQLVGAPLHLMSPEHAVVPLLCPLETGIPFSAALHVYEHHNHHHDDRISPRGARSSSQQQAPPPPPPAPPAGSESQSEQLVELAYVLSGSGRFTDGRGEWQHVAAGDSVFALQRDGLQFSAVGGGGDAAAAAEHHVPLVLLQLLMPRELLVAGAESRNPEDDARHAAAVSRLVPWRPLQSRRLGSGYVPAASSTSSTSSSSSTSSTSSSSIVVDPELACLLMGGAPAAAQQGGLHKQQQPPHTVVVHQHHDHHHHHHHHHRAAVDDGTSQHVVTHRRVSDVAAFQLPEQTNQIALLFGPHVQPAVSMSFGVEVFEPSQGTSLHSHDGAYELFLVLAGHGIGQHGPGAIMLLLLLLLLVMMALLLFVCLFV